MRIASWSLAFYRLPYVREVVWADTVEDAGTFALLRLAADTGAVGIAEGTIKTTWSGVSPRSLGAAIEDIWMPRLRGVDPNTDNRGGVMEMARHMRMLPGLLVAMVALIVGTTGPEAWAQKSKAVAASKRVAASKEVATFSIARIFFEFNPSASALGDLGVHVFLDGEDWRTLTIVNPNGRTIFEVEGKGPYRDLGLTELFFEGAEPDLADVPLAELLDRFPAGNYQLMGKTVDGNKIVGTATLTHAIPDGPFAVLAVLDGDSLVISWNLVTGSLTGEPVDIVAYQVIVGAFQVTVPDTILACAVPTVPASLSLCVTVSPQFVQSLGAGEHQFEVLAIEAGGNQTITEGSFTKP